MNNEPTIECKTNNIDNYLSLTLLIIYLLLLTIYFLTVEYDKIMILSILTIVLLIKYMLIFHNKIIFYDCFNRIRVDKYIGLLKRKYKLSDVTAINMINNKYEIPRIKMIFNDHVSITCQMYDTDFQTVWVHYGGDKNVLISKLGFLSNYLKNKSKGGFVTSLLLCNIFLLLITC